MKFELCQKCSSPQKKLKLLCKPCFYLSKINSIKIFIHYSKIIAICTFIISFGLLIYIESNFITNNGLFKKLFIVGKIFIKDSSLVTKYKDFITK